MAQNFAHYLAQPGWKRGGTATAVCFWNLMSRACFLDSDAFSVASSMRFR
jgi:hypothetical protein